jgi:hypothetical protein
MENNTTTKPLNQDKMDLETIKEVIATSSGIIEIGSVTLYLADRELQFDIEEHAIKGNHEFRVYQAFGTDLTDLEIEIDPDTHRILDEELIDFIHQHYAELSRL